MRNDIAERDGSLSELQLERLLRELLDKGGPESGVAGAPVSPETLELQASARRLRAASQYVPLPEGRVAVRQALLEIAERGRNDVGQGRASWRRAGLWLSMTALAVVAGAFALRSGALDGLFRPSGPMYGFRIVLDKARGILIPGHPAVSHYALSYRFPAVQVPSAKGATTTARGTVGGLPVTLTLVAAEQGCAGGHPCGTFVASLAGFSAQASSQFGELRGTFACEADGCTMAVAEGTGVFAKVSDAQLSVSGARASEGQFGSRLGSIGEWTRTVASAAEQLKAAGMLPAGVTVSDLVRDASNNGRAGGPDGRSTTGPSGKESGKIDNEDGTAGGSLGSRVIGGTRRGASVSGGATVRGNTVIGGGTISHSNHGGPAVQSGPRGGPGASGRGAVSTSAGVRDGASRGRRAGDLSDGRAGASTGPDEGTHVSGDAIVSGDVSTVIDAGTHVGGGATVGGASNANGGATVSGGISTGGSATTVTGGATVSGGISTGSGTTTVTGGATVSGGISTGSGTTTVTGGATVSGGTSTGSATNNASGGAAANGGASASGDAGNASGGAAANGGASAGGGAGNAGGGAAANGGASAGGGAGSVGGGASVNGGASIGGGVNVGGSVNVGGVGLSGGASLGGKGDGGKGGGGGGAAADKGGR